MRQRRGGSPEAEGMRQGGLDVARFGMLAQGEGSRGVQVMREIGGSARRCQSSPRRRWRRDLTIEDGGLCKGEEGEMLSWPMGGDWLQ